MIIGQSLIYKHSFIEEILNSILEMKYKKVHSFSDISQEIPKSEKKRKLEKLEIKEDESQQILVKISNSLREIYHTPSSIYEFQLLQIFLELFFHRRVFFSSSLISDAIQKRPPSVSVISIFLRIMILILQDHIQPSGKNNIKRGQKHYFMPIFTGYQFNNLITFFEGIFDGYFMKFAMEINGSSSSSNSELLNAFRELISTIKEMESNLQSLEELSSLTLIYRRTLAQIGPATHSTDSLNAVSLRKNESSSNELNRKPLVDFYSLEKLVV